MGKPLAITGLVLQLGALITLIATVIGIRRAHDNMSAAAEPTTLGGEISNAIYPMAAGSLLGLIGAILILAALFALRYRARWFQTMLWVLSIIWLMAFPVGTIVGIVVIIYLIKHKDEFKEPGLDSIRRPA